MSAGKKSTLEGAGLAWPPRLPAPNALPETFASTAAHALIIGGARPGEGS